MVRRLFSDFGTILISVALAIGVWVIAVEEENPITEGEFPEPVPVVVLNLPSDLVIFSDWNVQVRLKVRAPRGSWEQLSVDQFQAYVDLKGFEAGRYEVPVHVTCTDPSVRILSVSPSTVLIPLEEVDEKRVPVQVQVIGGAALGYEVLTDQMKVTPSEVVVRGPASLLDQVHHVEADLYLNEAKSSVERDLSLRPVTAAGESVGFLQFLTFSPERVTVHLPVEQRHGFREVAVKPVVVGNVAPGYWVSNVQVDPATLTLVGDPDAIAQIPGYVETLPLDIEGADGDVVERVALDLPQGVSVVGEQGVVITVSVTPLPGSRMVQRQPVVQGLGPEWKVEISPEVVELNLTGPLPRLDALKEEDVVVILDLSGIDAEGTYQIEPLWVVPEGVTVESVLPSWVTVHVERAVVTPTPTPTRTPRPMPTRRPTRTPSPTP